VQVVSSVRPLYCQRKYLNMIRYCAMNHKLPDFRHE
jgi:hypothetical protein